MTSKQKRQLCAWGYALAALLLTMTVLVSASAGTALGLQGTATPTPSPTPTGDTARGNNLDEAQRLYDLAAGAAQEGANFDVEGVILLTLRSLQAGYLPEADLLLNRMLDRLGTIEMVYYNSRNEYQYIADLAVSPDGQSLISAENDGNLRVYDVETGRVKATWPVMNGDFQVNALAYSPDGKMVAAGGYNTELLLLDSATGDSLFAPFEVRGEISDVAFNPDGSLLAVVSEAGEIGAYNTTTGQLVRQLHIDYSTYSISFSPDGQTALIMDTANQLHVWDIASGELVLNLYFEGVYINAVFMPDGKHAIVSNGHEKLFVIDLTNGDTIQEIQLTLDGGLHLALSPDGSKLLIGAVSAGDSALYDITTWELLQLYSAPGYEVEGIAFSPDSQDVFLAVDYGHIQRRSVNPTPLSGSLPGHISSITAVAYSADGQLMMTTDETGLVQIWDTADRQLVHSFDISGEQSSFGWILSAGFVDSTTVWTANYDLGIELWNIETGENIRRVGVEYNESLYGPPYVAISPDGKTAAITFSTSTILLFDLTTGEELSSLRQNNGTANLMQFSQDGTRLVVGGTDSRVRVFDLATGRIVKVLGPFGDDWVSVAFTPDATQVLVGESGGRMQIVEIATGNILRTFDMGANGGYYPPGITWVKFTQDTVRVLGLSGNGVLQLWDAPSGNVIRSFGNYTESLSDVALNPNETEVLVGDYLGTTVRVLSFDLADTIADACAMLTHDFTLEQLDAYGITNDVPPCPNLTVPQSAIAPTWTPNPTSTLPLWTPLPTLPPTNTPTMTPTPRQFTAQAGENRGSLAIGEVQQWTFEGQPGQAITIEIRADRPANNTDDETRARDNLLDTYLRVYTTFGVLLEENDDIDPGISTDSQVIELVPPYPGTVVIEVTSFDGLTAGDYTLVITTAGNSASMTATPSN